MNIEELETFVVLSKYLNFNKTGAVVHVAQSTVTLRIKNLETELGKPLFNREKKTISLTNEGKIFLEYAKTILKLNENLKKEIANISIYNSKISIASVQWFYSAYLYEKVEKLIKKNKNISTEIFLSHTEEIIPLMNNNIFDISFTTYKINNSEIHSELFFEDKVVLVGNKNFEDKKNGIFLKEISTLPVIYSDIWYGSMADLTKKIFSKNKIYRIQPNMLEISKNFTLQGYGICFLPLSMVEKEIKNKKLFEIPIKDTENFYTKIYISIHKARIYDPYLKLFFNEIKYKTQK